MTKWIAAIPSWISISRSYNALSKKSLHLPSVAQVGIVSSGFVTGLDLPTYAIATSALSVTLLFFSERLIAINYPSNLVLDRKNYFSELMTLSENMNSTFRNIKDIEDEWRKRMQGRLANIGNEAAKKELSDTLEQAYIFPDLTEYRAYFEDICNPSKQSALDLENPPIRFLISTFLNLGLVFFVFSLIVVAHKIWIS
jgi:hypothetical protein